MHLSKENVQGMRELGTVKEEKLEQLAIMRLRQLLFQNLVFLPGLKNFTNASANNCHA